MKKLTLLLSAMLFSMMSFAAEYTATISFADKAQRTVYTTEQQVWEQNGLVVTNDKSESTTNVGDYANPVRFYKSSALTIKCTLGTIKKIVFTCGSYQGKDYPGDLAASIGAEASVNGLEVTVTPTASSDIYAIAKLTAQVRVASIAVTYDGDKVPEGGDNGDDNGGDDNGGTTPPVDPGQTTIEIPAEAQGWNIPAEAIDVLQARAICAALEADATTGTKYYVMGYVKKLHNNHESGISGFGNATFYMENVKGAGSEEDFLAFQVYGLNGQKITDPTAVEVGDFVVIYGELTNYKGDTYETVGKGAADIWNSTNSLLSGGNTNPPTPPTTEGVITCAQAVEICKATGTTSTTEKYTIRGYVTEIKDPYSTQFGNITYWMADEKGGGQVLQAYRVKPVKDSDQAVKVNDYVEVVGTLVNYYGNTPEVNAGGTYTIITVGEEGEKPSLPEGLTGDGTKENPFTIEDVMTLNNQFAGPYYVKAFIVGQVNGAAITTGAEFDAPFSPSTNTDGTVNTYNTNLLVAASADVNDVAKCVPIQLPAGDLRTNFNLPENPEMDGKEVLICGTLTAYFKVPGIKNTSSIELLTPQDPNLVTIKGLEYADAFYEAYNNTWLIYLYPETEEFDPEVHTNLTLIITPKSSTAINGTYDLQAAMYFVSETDHVSGFDSTKPASVTIKNIDDEGNYSFVGSFVGEDAKTYTFDQVVNVYAIDSDTEEEIVLEETNTAVENVYVGENPVKFIENGQLMIIRGENVYNVLGAQVK